MTCISQSTKTIYLREFLMNFDKHFLNYSRKKSRCTAKPLIDIYRVIDIYNKMYIYIYTYICIIYALNDSRSFKYTYLRLLYIDTNAQFGGSSRVLSIPSPNFVISTLIIYVVCGLLVLVL